MSFKRALVTGGAGFIGSHIADALIRRRIKTIVVDDLTSGDRKHVNPNAEFVKHSVCAPSFGALLMKLKPDVVFHCAAQVDVRKSVEDPIADARTNILGTLALVKYAKAAGVKKIVFSSSGGAMFSDAVKPPYRESQPADPVSPYGISKLAGELYLAFAARTLGIETVVLRYANVYGPRQGSGGEAGVVSVFASRILAGKGVTIFGDGKQTRDFVYVGDVVSANMLAMKPGIKGTFHVGTGVETSVKSLYQLMCRGLTLPVSFAPGKAGEVRRSALDSSKIRKELGWKSEMSLEEGLTRTLQSVRNLGKVKTSPSALARLNLAIRYGEISSCQKVIRPELPCRPGRAS